MTPEQQRDDRRYFHILLISVWSAALLAVVTGYLFVQSCRQTDLKTIREWIDAEKCICRQTAQIHEQTVNLVPGLTRESITREIAHKLLEAEQQRGTSDARILRNRDSTD